jgi:hypothetical protein
MNEIDLDAQEEEAQEKQEQRDELIALLDDFESYGGNAAELFIAIRVMVDNKSAKQGANDWGQLPSNKVGK